MARILIVGGGCRGRQLATAMVSAGHVVRISTRTEAGRGAIEAAGAECWVGTPDRLATLRGALENVTILCWLMGSATGAPGELAALHTSRLEFLLTQAIDTTVRGLIYEAGGTGDSAQLAADGAEIVRTLTARNAIPARLVSTDPSDVGAWVAEAAAGLQTLLSCA
jgi:uncharacterized protein YbjT (DUF2867 family)